MQIVTRKGRGRGLLPLALGIVFLFVAQLPALAGQAYFIMDAKTGKTLASSNADVLNHPASLTKMMTLYMTFDALHRGKLTWNTKIKITKNAASKIPTKFGIRAGRTITVREAVLGMIVLSANDAAAAMGDRLGGTEAKFAKMMTAKAHALGMRRTVFYNASGLPHSRQVTTARDMSTLGIALQRDFPKEYKLFATKSFKFRGRNIRGHNNLMYRYDGMDGIKTGYTNASGFNLVSSVKRSNRHVVGVVLGGRTARSRDAQMARLLDKYVPEATRSRASTLVAATPSGRQKAVLAKVDNLPVPRRAPRVDQPIEIAAAGDAVIGAIVSAEQPASVAPRGNWAVQIAATDSERSALALLRKARQRTGNAISGRDYTEAVQTGGSTLYRARFVDFSDRGDADAACRVLKQKSFACLVLASR